MNLQIGDIIGSGHQGRVYALDDGLVLKVYTKSNNFKTAQAEFSMAEFAANGDINTPLPHQVYILNEETPAISFDRISGESVAEYVLKRPWTVLKLTKETAKLLSQIHSLDAPEWARTKKRALASRIGRVPELDEKTKADILTYLDTLEDGHAFCHNDFHPGNVFISPDGLQVIDWGGGKKSEAIQTRTCTSGAYSA